MSTVNPREVITRSLGAMVDLDRRYARQLDPEIAPWHCYTLDGGHSILVVLDHGKLGDRPTSKELEDNLVPAPVKTVERVGWRLVGGYVVCKLPYHPVLGLITPESDDEYGDTSSAAAGTSTASPTSAPGTVERSEYPKQFAKRRDAELPDFYWWLPKLYRSTAARLEKLERQAERQFPGIFDRLEARRAQHADTWPTWCWMPIGAVRAVLEHEYAARVSNLPLTGAGLDPQQIASMGSAGDAAKIAAIGAWRSAGRHAVNFHDSMTDTFEAQGDALPLGLEERWPLLGVYVTSEAGGKQGSAGCFLHLEWDEHERRTELRLMMDAQPTAALAGLHAQPVFLAGHTVREALAETWTATLMRMNSMTGSDKILDISQGGEFDLLIRAQAQHVGVWVAVAAALVDDDLLVRDAAEVLDRPTAGETWPPKSKPAGKAPVLWAAAPRTLWEQDR
ncbi:hypothetical protein ABZ864_40325 [Streptomyces sp. NPDC047082]|uniref:hypothetical protein n=1 Tax=Streptomyces sp. NPDC047082 TaxID=3155259 RepID=UPI0033CB76E8